MNNIPVSTNWLLQSTGSTNNNLINSVFLIFCPKTGSKGTGFLIDDGFIVTNWHVIKNVQAENIRALSSKGREISFDEKFVDKDRDLAVLKPVDDVGSGLEIEDENLTPKTKVLTWGHPLAYNGPAPILSVGYLAGYNEHRRENSSDTTKRYVINGAFNPGNSGGPLLVEGSDKVAGVVVAKHSPISVELKTALKALSENTSGLQFSGEDAQGNKITFSESQLVAKLLEHQREMTQVMLGEAIVAKELKEFLDNHVL